MTNGTQHTRAFHLNQRKKNPPHSNRECIAWVYGSVAIYIFYHPSSSVNL